MILLIKLYLYLERVLFYKTLTRYLES